MNIKKKIAALVLAVSTLTAAAAGAEQAKAEEYRQMFASGNFYVEYMPYSIRGVVGDIKDMKIFAVVMGSGHSFNRFLAGSGGKRMQSIGSNKKPMFLYQDGKYYQFAYVPRGSDPKKPKTIAIMLPESKLHDDTLNPDEDWEGAKERLALPDELAVFYWNDPYRNDLLERSAPYYNGNSKRTIEDKEYDCDQYVIDIKTMEGTIIAQEAYNMLYDAGNLKSVQKIFLRDGKEYVVSGIGIKVLSNTIPEGKFQIPRNTKVYAAGKGDMDDLLERPQQVEILGGAENEK
ncbi:MAG: hypothetical protein IJ812_07655 [Schwartzia sp.]|nr:hypothetical protein [Schwartzia sp. (in: firmicutes)]MBR1886269.1 hypothetical protein [Schwartzia sp. (in: firmicutes)]